VPVVNRILMDDEQWLPERNITLWSEKEHNWYECLQMLFDVKYGVHFEIDKGLQILR